MQAAPCGEDTVTDRTARPAEGKHLETYPAAAGCHPGLQPSALPPGSRAQQLLLLAKLMAQTSYKSLTLCLRTHRRMNEQARQLDAANRAVVCAQADLCATRRELAARQDELLALQLKRAGAEWLADQSRAKYERAVEARCVSFLGSLQRYRNHASPAVQVCTCVRLEICDTLPMRSVLWFVGHRAAHGCS